MSVGIEPVIPDHDLALIGDVGRDPGDELQIIHRLQFRAVLTMTVANFALMLQKQEAVQRQDGPDHVFPDPLGLGVNAYNILNSQRPVSFVKADNTLFGQVWAR